MITGRKVSVMLVIQWAVFLTGCKPGDGKTHNRTGKEKSYQNISVRSLAGSRFYYKVKNTTKTTFNINGTPAEQDNTVEAGLIYEVLSDSSGTAVRVTYDKFAIVTDNGNLHTEASSEDGAAAFEAAGRMLALLKGSTVTVRVDTGGNAVEVSGYRELTDKILSNIAIQSESDKQQMRAQMEAMLGKDFIKNNMAQGFSMFPGEPVYAGDSWIKTYEHINELGMKISSTYTLESVDDGIADIKSSAVISDDNKNVNLMGYNVAAKLKGEEEGRYKADTKTGMLVSGTSGISIKGTVSAQGREIPLHIKVTREMSMQKIR